MLEDTDPIYCYARADAIADGTLVDITEAACEAGFRVPVALTRTVWCDCVHWGPDDNVGPLYQDEAGRLWDVICMAARAAKANRKPSVWPSSCCGCRGALARNSRLR